MKRMNRYFISIIFTATLLASGCAQRLTQTPIAVGEPKRGSAGATRATTRSKALVGKVVSIADGDTLTVLDASDTQHRIRLSGIDAPESRQAFGTRSRQHLADLVFNKQGQCCKNSLSGIMPRSGSLNLTHRVYS